MSNGSNRYVLIAVASATQGQALGSAATELGLERVIIEEVEELLFRTRGEVPEALVLGHELAERVSELDIVSLLRRRKALADLPIIYLGPSDPVVQAGALESGADAYLVEPGDPRVLRALLNRLLLRRRSDAALRSTLERLREFERAYKESERVKEDLTHMLVHDLKSPIASVMGLLDHSLEMLKGTGGAAPAGEEQVTELLALARTEAQHLLGLAANILDVRRMKEGHMPYHPDLIEDLEALARQALADVSGGPRQRNFSFLVHENAARLQADGALLRRILANLFANAVKHTRTGGYIDFRAWREDGAYVLSVRDDGEGIPAADHKRIFNAFEQSRHTIHDRYDTGMGLTFCKLAVEKHGGRIWVESQPGRGSTFYFTLPVELPVVVTDDSSLGVV